MMKKIVWLTVILLCCSFVASAARNVVDLSGAWVLDKSKSDPLREMGRGRGGADQGAPVGGPPGGRRSGAGAGMPPVGGRGMGLPGGMGRGMAGDVLLLIRQSGSLLNLSWITKSGDGEQTTEQNFSLDGKENTNPMFMGRGTLSSTATWVMDTLVIQGSQKLPAPEGEIAVNVMEEFSLADGGKTLILKTTIWTPMGERTTKQVFTKQS
jgi:hypothetical protein